MPPACLFSRRQWHNRAYAPRGAYVIRHSMQWHRGYVKSLGGLLSFESFFVLFVLCRQKTSEFIIGHFFLFYCATVKRKELRMIAKKRVKQIDSS